MLIFLAVYLQLQPMHNNGQRDARIILPHLLVHSLQTKLHYPHVTKLEFALCVYLVSIATISYKRDDGVVQVVKESIKVPLDTTNPRTKRFPN